MSNTTEVALAPEIELKIDGMLIDAAKEQKQATVKAGDAKSTSLGRAQISGQSRAWTMGGRVD